MGGQLDGNFLPVSLPHKFILIVTSFVCLWWIIFFLPLPLSTQGLVAQPGGLNVGLCGASSYNSWAVFAAVMELVGRRYRTVLGALIMMSFSVGYMLQPLAAYFLRDSTWYQLAASGMSFFYPLIILYVHTPHTHTHTHPFNDPFPGLPRWAGTRKVKPI